MLGRMRNVVRRWRSGSRGWPASGVDLLTGLEAYYRLDGTLADSSGNGRDLTEGATPSAYGTGLLGTGLGDGGGTATGFTVTPSPGLSVSAWIFQETGFTATGIARAAFMAGAVTALGVQTRATNGSASVIVNNLTAHTISPVSPGDWHHVVASWDGTDLTVWYDGAIVHQAAAAPTGPFDGTRALWTASPSDASVVDEGGFWSRARSAAQVAALYNGGDGFDPTA
jgi:hypothetical protein